MRRTSLPRDRVKIFTILLVTFIKTIFCIPNQYEPLGNIRVIFSLHSTVYNNVFYNYFITWAELCNFP